MREWSSLGSRRCPKWVLLSLSLSLRRLTLALFLSELQCCCVVAFFALFWMLHKHTQVFNSNYAFDDILTSLADNFSTFGFNSLSFYSRYCIVFFSGKLNFTLDILLSTKFGKALLYTVLRLALF